MLTKSAILEEIRKGNIVIQPFNQKQLNPNSYNVTLNERLEVYACKVLDAYKPNPTEEIIIPKEGYVLKPNVLYLARTNEYTETYASATALIRNARVAMINNPNSLLWKVVDNPEKLDGMAFFDALAMNDKVANIVFEQYIEDLAEGLTNLANIFRPDAIILGGGISYRGDSLMEPLQNRLAKMIYGGQWNARVELMVSTLKNDAGIYGAYAMCTKLK